MINVKVVYKYHNVRIWMEYHVLDTTGTYKCLLNLIFLSTEGLFGWLTICVYGFGVLQLIVSSLLHHGMVWVN